MADMIPTMCKLVVVAVLTLWTGSAGCRREPAPTVENGAAGATPIPAAAAPSLPAAAFPKPDRPVASIVSATWDNEDARDRVGEADTVMALLGISTGMGIADIGAGSGYYTVRLSPRVGTAGRVFAEDIMPNYVRDLTKRIEKEKLANVRVILGSSDNPRLPPASVDRALFVHMYHEIDQPYALLYNLHPSLKPGASVGIVDVDRPTSSHGTPPAQLKCEMAAAGYDQTAFHTLAVGYLAVFKPFKQSSPEEVRAAIGSSRFRQRRC